MTTLTTYDLAQFVADMNELLDSQPDEAKLFDRGSVYLERLVTIARWGVGYDMIDTQACTDNDVLLNGGAYDEGALELAAWQ